jgi:hypothetical protein
MKPVNRGELKLLLIHPKEYMKNAELSFVIHSTLREITRGNNQGTRMTLEERLQSCGQDNSSALQLIAFYVD